jgi:hypothetical protein
MGDACRGMGPMGSHTRPRPSLRAPEPAGVHEAAARPETAERGHRLCLAVPHPFAERARERPGDRDYFAAQRYVARASDLHAHTRRAARPLSKGVRVAHERHVIAADERTVQGAADALVGLRAGDKQAADAELRECSSAHPRTHARRAKGPRVRARRAAARGPILDVRAAHAPRGRPHAAYRTRRMRRVSGGRMRPPAPRACARGTADQPAAAKRSATFDQSTTFHHASR